MVSSTRKSTRLSTKAVAAPAEPAPSPAPAKKETTTKKKKKESVTKAASTATKSKKKKETVVAVKKAVAKKVTAPNAVKKAAAAVVGSKGTKKIVIIEACKQWGAFKTRANKILKAVGDKATVQINKEKPGKGNFVVSVEGIDEPIVSLLAMKRPFPTLKALDMDEINEKVISALS